MFEIAEGKVQLIHKNERLEKHGDEDVLACDLNFSWETGNGCLAMFAPDLRSMFYKRLDDAQQELDPDPEHLTALRFPGLGKSGVVGWELGELTGGTLTFHVGVKTKFEIPMQKLAKFKLEPKEGGTVVVYFQVQCHPNEQQSGKLSKFYADKHCIITITPPPIPSDLAGE